MLPAVIKSIGQAYREIKHYCGDSWEGEVRQAAKLFSPFWERRSVPPPSVGSPNSWMPSLEAFHARKLADAYEIPILDGIVIKRQTGLGSQKRSILVALGVRRDGGMEIIDFRQTSSESQSAWEGFLNHLYQRGLNGTRLKMILIDGGKGLQAALPLVYGEVPLQQRCWAHKTRNILNYVRRADQEKVKKNLHRISHAQTLRAALQAAQQFRRRWPMIYPQAVSCLQADLMEHLTFLHVKTCLEPTALRTTNAIERRFREVRRRTGPMGVFSDHTSIERILFSIFLHENFKQSVNTPFLLTQNN